MFRPQATRPSHVQTGFEFLELIYHATIRNLRKGHGNAIYGLVMNVVQAAMILVIFVVMFSILGMKRTAIRGDFDHRGGLGGAVSADLRDVGDLADLPYALEPDHHL